MSAVTGIVRWESTADPSRWGVEITGHALLQDRLEAQLDRRLSDGTIVRPAFVFAALDSVQPDEIAIAVSRASGFSHGARVFVALDHETLSVMDAEFLRDMHVGIVLDQVDSHTPLSAVSADLIEAVRFEESFVQRASANARMACVLDTMLRLAHDLGLATLATTATRGRSNTGIEFDYVSTPPARNRRAASTARPVSAIHTLTR
jgi:hypothetical protein